MNRLSGYNKSLLFNKLVKLNSFRFHLLLLLFGIGFLFNFNGCFGCPYSFTGASVPPHLKTIAIPFADDRSGFGEPGLREMLTDKLTQKFIEDNNLSISERTNADAILECVITGINDAPAVVTSGETVASRRISISVQVIYKDLVKRITIYEKQFSNYGDYDSAAGVTERTKGIEEAINKISEDILLDTVSGW
jgi:hypothetical protein